MTIYLDAYLDGQENQMLISFNMASNKPQHFRDFCQSLTTTVSDEKCLEILVLIDQGDLQMKRTIEAERKKRDFSIKSLEWPANGYFGLWRGLNELHRLCDPAAYFVCNINDEIRFNTVHWDKNLNSYKHFFPDDIFRLCTSVSKYRNYSDFWECGYAPENYPIATKKWIDFQGNWGACHGPDAFQQFVSFYLCKCNSPNMKQYRRDLPIRDLEISGEGAYLGMEESAMWERVRRGWKAWHKITSFKMQIEACRRASLLYLNILAQERGWEHFVVEQKNISKMLVAKSARSGKVYMKKSYFINPLLIIWPNLKRRRRKYHHCGGGPPPFKHTWLGSFLYRILKLG